MVKLGSVFGTVAMTRALNKKSANKGEQADEKKGPTELS
jgi:hypothetical protein